jgi:hypothetical protein
MFNGQTDVRMPLNSYLTVSWAKNQFQVILSLESCKSFRFIWPDTLPVMQGWLLLLALYDCNIANSVELMGPVDLRTRWNSQHNVQDLLFHTPTPYSKMYKNICNFLFLITAKVLPGVSCIILKFGPYRSSTFAVIRNKKWQMFIFNTKYKHLQIRKFIPTKWMGHLCWLQDDNPQMP